MTTNNVIIISTVVNYGHLYWFSIDPFGSHFEMVILEVVIWYLNGDFEINKCWVWFEFSFEIEIQTVVKQTAIWKWMTQIGNLKWACIWK